MSGVSTEEPNRSLTIFCSPKVSGGEPVVWGTLGARAVDLLDRIDSGDSVEEVAQDFSCDPGSLELLLELREVVCRDAKVFRTALEQIATGHGTGATEAENLAICRQIAEKALTDVLGPRPSREAGKR